MNKVFYYNEKLNVLMSREEIKSKIEHLKEDKITFNKYEGTDPLSSNLERPRLNAYQYNLYDIPFHSDWETIVIDDTTLDLSDYVELMSCSYNAISPNLYSKLLKNIDKMKGYQYKGINFK